MDFVLFSSFLLSSSPSPSPLPTLSGTVWMISGVRIKGPGLFFFFFFAPLDAT